MFAIHNYNATSFIYVKVPALIPRAKVTVLRLVRPVIDDRAIGVMREVRAASSAQGDAAGSAPASFSVVGQNARLRGHWGPER